MTIPLDALLIVVGMLAACYLISWAVGRWERCRTIIDAILRSLDDDD